jgi:hypothetical protein
MVGRLLTNEHAVMVPIASTSFSHDGLGGRSDCSVSYGSIQTHTASWAVNRPISPRQVVLSRYITNAWANFARNPEGGPGWLKVGKFEEDVAVLGAFGTSGTQMVRRDVMAKRCNVFASSA